MQAELEAIVPRFLSVPVAPLINQTGKEYASFAAVRRHTHVVKPTTRLKELTTS